MEFFEHLYTMISIVNGFLALAVIFLERKHVAATWAWLIVLLFLPGIGFLFYLLFGQNFSRKRLYRLRARELLAVKGLVREQRKTLAAGELQYVDSAVAAFQDIIALNLMNSYALYTQDNEVDIFTDGKSKFAALIKSIEEAQNHIHLLYYIVRNDELGRQIVQLLTEKAKAGVEVKLLYDQIGSLGLTTQLLDPLVKAGGQVAAFFPSKIPYLNIKVNFRNHRKIVVIDGRVGYLGGFNIGDEYLGKDNKVGYWRDTHLKLKGGAVHMLQARFLLDWNLSSEVQLGHEDRFFPKTASQGKVGIQIVSSGPNTDMEQIKDGYLKMIYAAKESICLQTPYFVPDESFVIALKTAALSGVDVKIMIPKKPDHKLIYWVSNSYLGDLLDCGIQCYLYEKGFLHAKTLVCDGKIASVGSANIDIRSFKLNFEINAFIFDSTIATQLENIFMDDIKNCHQLTMQEYRRRSVLTRSLESVTRLLSPIL